MDVDDGGLNIVDNSRYGGPHMYNKTQFNHFNQNRPSIYLLNQDLSWTIKKKVLRRNL